MKKYIMQKSIKVTEPDCWYGEKYITVSMFSLEYKKDAVRIIFESKDDFAVYQDVCDWDKEHNIEWAKKYLWDNLPEEVSLNWLYTHGYRPF